MQLQLTTYVFLAGDLSLPLEQVWSLTVGAEHRLSCEAEWVLSSPVLHTHRGRTFDVYENILFLTFLYLPFFPMRVSVLQCSFKIFVSVVVLN